MIGPLGRYNCGIDHAPQRVALGWENAGPSALLQLTTAMQWTKIAYDK